MDEINVKVWFSNRKMAMPPRHFIKCATPITAQSYAWILNTLTGRFSLGNYADHEGSNDILSIIDFKQYPYFEDSGEAMMYELRWAGDK